jgi:Fic family protein
MDSFIKFVGHNAFQEKLHKREGLSRAQLLAYKDFQNNFESRKNAIEEQLQAPISKYLSKREVVNLYGAHIENNFTIKQFSEKTGMNKNTARREINNAVKRGLIEKIERKHKEESQEYRYK